MTPHDSTRCACGHAEHKGSRCEQIAGLGGASCECVTPSEPVGAVDADAEALTWLRNKRENTSGGERSKRIISHIITRLARATPAEGEAVAWAVVNPQSAQPLVDAIHDGLVYWTEVTARESQAYFDAAAEGEGVHRVIPLYTTPPRSPQDIARAVLGDGWLADSLDTPEKLRDYFVEYGRQSAPPRSPATVTEAMVERAVEYELGTYPAEAAMQMRKGGVVDKARDYYRNLLTAALLEAK